jgi:hypothetical protein
MALRTVTPAVMSASTSAPAPVPLAVSPQAAFSDDIAKQQMAESFAVQSGMNVRWARK